MGGWRIKRGKKGGEKERGGGGGGPVCFPPSLPPLRLSKFLGLRPLCGGRANGLSERGYPNSAFPPASRLFFVLSPGQSLFPFSPHTSVITVRERRNSAMSYRLQPPRQRNVKKYYLSRRTSQSRKSTKEHRDLNDGGQLAQEKLFEDLRRKKSHVTRPQEERTMNSQKKRFLYSH